MSKKFWFECFKKCLKITIPTLITIVSLISLFFSGFEASLQSLGIIGFILVCCLCFLITILLELTGMIKIIDDIGQQYIEKNKDVDQSIYGFYNSYKKSLKKSKNNDTPFLVLENQNKDGKVIKRRIEEIDGDSENFDNYSIGVNHKSINYHLEISYPDVVMDVIQEFSNIAISSAYASFTTIYAQKPVYTQLPESIICKSIVEFNKIIETKESMNIVISFDGLIQGCFLICFDKKSILQAQGMLESNYKKYYTNLQSMLLSYFKEIATILAGAGITSLCQMLPFQTPNGAHMGKINIREIAASLNFLNIFFNSDSIVSVKNICRIPKLANIHMYLLFSIHQAKIISEKMTSYNNKHQFTTF